MEIEDNLIDDVDLTELLSQLLDELIINSEKLDGLIYEKEYVKNNNNLRNLSCYKAKGLLLNFLTILSCFLAASGTKVLFQYSLYGPDYFTKVSTYSTETDETIDTETIKKKLVGSDDRQVYKVVTIEKANPWQKINDEYTKNEYYQRDIEITKIFDKDFEELNEYLELDLESLELDKETFIESEKKTNITNDELRQETVKTVIEEIQNPKEYSVGVYTKLSEKVITNIFVISNILLTYILTEKALSDKYDNDFIPLREQIENLRSLLKDIKYNKRINKRKKKKIMFLSIKIKDIINSNDKISKKISELSKKSECKDIFNKNKERLEEIKTHIEAMKKHKILAFKK